MDLLVDPIDDATLRQKVNHVLTKADGAQVDRLITAYRTGRPNIGNTDLYLILASDATFRQNVLAEAERYDMHSGCAQVHEKVMMFWLANVGTGIAI